MLRVADRLLPVGLVLASLGAGACAPPADSAGGPPPNQELSKGGGTALGAAPECVTKKSLRLDPLQCANKNESDALDDALSRVGLQRCSTTLADAALAQSKLDVNDPRMIASVRDGLRAPLALPSYGAAVSSALDDAISSKLPVTRAIVVASELRDGPVDACAFPLWYDTKIVSAPLADALADLRKAPPILEEVKAIPLDLQTALAPIVRAIAAANDEVAAVRASLSAADAKAAHAVPAWLLGVRRFEWTKALPGTFDAIDATRIARAGANVALVVESADLSRFAGLALEPIDLATPIGVIRLRGAGNDTWSDAKDAPLFSFDTGGDDTYLGPVGSSSPTRPASVLVDLDGSDRYGYAEAPVAADALGRRLPSDGEGRAPEGRTLSRTGRQGSGVFGVGLVFDYGKGSDSYRSLIASQGAASHGVGVLFDGGGDDTYEAEGFSQGAAAWGVGLLLDGSGNDRFTLYNSGQGFGFTRGVGAIVDRAGDDAYEANSGEDSLGGDIVYPSDQLAAGPGAVIVANHSFAQGCGAGHRPDWPDAGFPFPGGIGILRDVDGSDRYFAGVFGQGIGFVQGLGMLLEGKGDDHYDGLYYVQGVGAHMGLALFVDSNGADAYDLDYPNQGASLGLANDLSAAVNYDAGGSDSYHAAALSLGAALANGISIFANDLGDDTFVSLEASACGLALTGDVKEQRKSLLTVGAFVKAGGETTYTVGDVKKSHAAQCGEDDDHHGKHHDDDDDHDEAEKHVGVDAPKGRVRF